jgi:peroxiredoxin
MDPSTRKNTLTVLLLVIIVIMGCEIGYLIYQNRELQSMLAQAASVQILQQGQSVPPLTAEALDGTAVSVRYAEREPSTVLIWFSPSCHVCGENSAFWNELYRRYGSSPGVRFLALSDTEANETRTYVSEHSLAFPIVCVTDDRLIDAYNGRVMPQTAIISPRGGIVQVWPGALETARQNEIITLLDSLTS